MSTVTLPLWLAVLVGVLALIGLLDRLLAPSVRWFIRSRANKVLDEVGSRLRIEIRAFQQTHRQVLIDRLLYDEKVQQAAAAFGRAQDMPREVVMARIRGYAREIVPAFNAYFYFRVGYWLGRKITRLLYRVRVGYTDDEGLARVPPTATVVFVMNHRSNMDYVLVAFMAAERTALSYAVGEWARVWPLQALVRSLGAYFVRRNSGDPLYRAVLSRYVQMATEAGVPQALFPEGGLTVDGALRAPKFGLLDYMVKSFHADGERDLVFIPVGINYDRVLEDRSQLLKLDPNRRRAGVTRALGTTLGFALHNLRLAVSRRWYRLGYACVNFGSPVSLRQYVREHGIDFARLDDAARRPAVAALGNSLMAAIGAVIPVVPVALVAQVFRLDPHKPRSELELKSAAFALLQDWEHRGVHVYIPRGDRDYAIGVGLRMLALRHIVEEKDGVYLPVAENAKLLDYYANSIAHVAPRVDGPVLAD